MPARRKVVLVPLFCLIIGTMALIEQTGQRIPRGKVRCLRNCRLAPKESSKRETQISRSVLSCQRQCLHGYKGQHALNKQDIKLRKRKSVLQDSECSYPSSSPAGEWIPSEVEVTFGQDVNTSGWYMNATWPSMKDPQGNWNGILIRLSVDDSLIAPVYCCLLPKNQTFFTVNISAYNYHYPNPVYFKVIGHPFSNAMSNITRYCPDICKLSTPCKNGATCVNTGCRYSCQCPANYSGKHCDEGTNYTSPTPNHTVLAVSFSIGILVGIFLVVGMLKYFVWHKKSPVLPKEFDYHAFIIYNNADRVWVASKLLPLLEEKHHLKCCVHYRDFAPGQPFRDSMAESVYKSYKIIAVLSSNFLKSNYCIYELNIAKYRLLNRRDDSLVMIRVDEANSKELPRELRKRNFIDYCNPFERPFWEKKLLKFLNVQNDDCTNESATSQQNGYDSNMNNCSVVAGKNDERVTVNRLNSTTSHSTEISILTSNEGEII